MRLRCVLLLAAAMASSAAAEQPKYRGPGSCDGSACHGAAGEKPEQANRIKGNEYATWSEFDKHSTKAYKVLAEPRAKRMGEILKIADVSTDKRCTVCHVVGSPKQASDGVACEACHGSADQWLGTHTNPNSHADSVAKGMIDTKNLEIRAKTCLACHLGAGEKVVDHELIAAGHPDLPFELDTFSEAQPSHYREPKPAAGNSLPHVRVWAVGQAAELASGMQLLSVHAGKQWPEFSDLECYQCHHDLRLDSWRIQRGYAGRYPGGLQVNQARYEVLRELVAQAASGERDALESSMAVLTEAVSRHPCDSAAVEQAARRVEQIAVTLAARFEKQDFDSAAAHAMIKALAGDIQRIANAGEQSAEQAAMSLDSLIAAYAPSPPGQPGNPQLKPLYDYLEHPSTYQPGEFASLFRKAAASAP